MLLDFASKDVKNSSLLSDTLKEQDNMTKTLQKIEENRDENLKLLKQKKSLIIKQISAASMTSSVSVILDSRLYLLLFSVMFQSYNLVLLTYRKVK